MANEFNKTTENLYTSLLTLTINEPPSQTQQITTNRMQTIMPANLKKNRPSILSTQNVPEKIIFCFDVYSDPEATLFKFGDSSKFTSLQMVKRAIEIFVQNKNAINQRHEYALLTTNGKIATCERDFTSNPRDIIKALNNIKMSDVTAPNIFDVNSILNTVLEMVTLSNANPPTHVVRVILLYSRTNCTPTISNEFSELLSHPYFVIDVMMHEDSEIDGNKYEEFYETLSHIDEKGYSYNFAVCRNATVFLDAMAKLLAHPLQRAEQSQAFKPIAVDKQE